MRPQQQNRRMRGRGNNNQNRKGPNPLTRNYESNGPDVKIRGSAQQIAEKYANLARDAQSAGDRVMAENYLQHAEHYNRIIAAAQAQAAAQQPMRDNRDDMDDGEDGRDDFEPVSVPEAARQSNDGSGPQPVIEGMPAEVALDQENIRREDRNQERRPNGVNGGEHDENQRRGRRPRRSRGRGDQTAASEAESGDETAAEDRDEIAIPAIG
jgi:hypothetical protein